jgi:hypothetical protein
MTPIATIRALTLILAAALLGGCGSTTKHTSPLGRSFTASPGAVSKAPIGDPPGERHGTIPARLARELNTPGSPASTPQVALLRYARLYTNWQAANLPAQERRLANLAIGPARLAAEQASASHSATAMLAANHVQNNGVVISIAPRQGPARSQWVIVTQERTTGTGPYAGLPTTLHVTLARVTRVNQIWVVNAWSPQD